MVLLSLAPQVDTYAASVGAVEASLLGILSASGLSQPVPATPVVITGSWGVPSAPAISGVVARNAGGQVCLCIWAASVRWPPPCGLCEDLGAELGGLAHIRAFLPSVPFPLHFDKHAPCRSVVHPLKPDCLMPCSTAGGVWARRCVGGYL